MVKIRGGQVRNRPIYAAIGVDLDGHKDVLGTWAGDGDGESAKFWFAVLRYTLIARGQIHEGSVPVGQGRSIGEGQMSNIKIYLRNHEAAAQAGRDLFRRTARAQRARPWASDLQALTSEVDADVRSLRQIMRTVSVSPDRVAGLALRLGERAARLKPNGHLLRRAPLSDLIEVEGLLDAVRAKQAGWHALDAAQVLPSGLDSLLDDLLRRADGQVTRLITVHRQTAKATLVH